MAADDATDAVTMTAVPGSTKSPCTNNLGVSTLQQIKADFRRCSISERDSISAEELTGKWVQLVEDDQLRKGNGPLTLQDKQVISLRVSQLWQELDLSNKGRVGMQEWVHYMLLRPSRHAARQINSLLKDALVQHPRILEELQQMFEKADATKSGRLTFREIVEMYSQKLWHLRPGSDGKPLSDKELSNGNAEHFAKDIVDAMDLDGDERITYTEFMAYCVGRRKEEVLLNLYDITDGLAAQVSPWLLGSKLEAVWHTGIVAFGKEYFFTRDAVFDTPGKTSFGVPKKQVRLGLTLWRQSELHQHIVDELKPVFHRDTYDLVTNNCNHFTDRISMYLLGKHLPEEVLQQSEQLLKSGAVRVMRPLLTWWLRDGVVARAGANQGKEIQVTSEARMRAEKAPRPGTVVTIHPTAENEGAAVLGMVCNPEQPIGGGSTLAKDALATPRCALCGCQFASFASNLNDKVWVRYFELASADSMSNTCGQLHTELVPFKRLSIEKVTEPASASESMLIA